MELPKSVIVTGGAQGIGKAITKMLLEKDWQVMMADIDEEAGYETLDEYKEIGRVGFFPCDVSKEQDITNLLDSTVERFGCLSGLVNNAGISRFKPIDQASLDDWRAVIDTNLTGTFLCSKYAVPYLQKAKGAIVNISSTRALMSEPNTEAYAASKGGLVALTHSLAMSLGPEVRVNCICPGWIETDDWQKQSSNKVPVHTGIDRSQHPVGRVGVPNDIASLVSYLLSEEAGFITGANFVVDGGMTRKMIYAE